ncbi:MAG: hypothetical protein ACOX0J_13940 [Thermoactinomyces vulgaris]|jgi:hypothetical protein|uniref:hypothetical protein n=1 Tax=Thermoactinomyces TaxID=2023 RepID=UPI0006737D00|nr:MULTISPECIES: hypothetical protein [Thermoactinomyces]MBH8582894.1 hypothetical protein [Thermoactinomyces sp. CICC 10735]MBI0391592.1 hypothetical protein [Thermoactinomyces sp. CICC 24226]QBK13745.1 hypothetical protein AB849_009120 [Thermoactinomyces vulgaris]
MALPVTLMVVTFLFTLIMLSVSQMVQVRNMQTLYQERVKSRYVAESGIAVVQQQLRLNGQNRADAPDETMIQVEDRYVLVKVEVKPSRVHVQATTWGEQGVVQTVEAFLHPDTYAVSRWIR